MMPMTFRPPPTEESRMQLRSHYGNFKLAVDRDMYFDNDTLMGTLKCEISNLLPCKVIIARLRCVLKRAEGKVMYPTTTLFRANRILTTRCTLQPVGKRHELDCEGSYSFDFSFSIDSGFPNSMLCEIFHPYSKVLVEWYIAALCKTANNDQILLAKTRIAKGAMYVPQCELQPKACLGKGFFLDRMFNSPNSKMYLYVLLDKNVYAINEPIAVRVHIINESSHVRVTKVTAKAKQIFQNSIGCELIMMESPALDAAEVRGPSCNQGVILLKLKPKVECNCSLASANHSLPSCARIAHVPSKLGCGHGVLASSSVSRHWDSSLEQIVSYMVKVKVHVSRGRNIKLWVPFSLTNSNSSTQALGVFMQAHLVSATPVIGLPPSYDSIDTHSTAMSNHVRSRVEMPQKVSSIPWRGSCPVYLDDKELAHAKHANFSDDGSVQIDGNSIEM